MELFFKPSALRVIKKLSARERAVFHKVISQLQETPEAGGFLKGSLQGLRKWKFRVNGVPYRIVYKIESADRLTIIALGKLKDFYDLLEK
ncbi:type II toxin-antitoxin system RelE/ParE family toxin [Candidatus Berkelbacteria bacterium]|nr:type II toxin-antitoxin system RelE/ParE family toxin [Candidatus Berkelbacteria bacterium]